MDDCQKPKRPQDGKKSVTYNQRPCSKIITKKTKIKCEMKEQSHEVKEEARAVKEEVLEVKEKIALPQIASRKEILKIQK